MKRIIRVVVCLLLLVTLLPISAMVGDETNLEISDNTGDERFVQDIQKAWFFEDATGSVI